MRMTVRFFKYLLPGLSLLWIARPAFAQTTPTPPPAPKSIFEHLTVTDCPKITLELDVTSIIAAKKTNQYFPANMTDASGQTYALEVKPRGRYRRKVSEIPPLKLKFKNKTLTEMGFDTLNEIKLVLPYKVDEKGDELIIKEYLIYRMFEKVTPAAIRARLIRLTLRNTHVEKSKQVMYAILVEHEEETAKRLSGIPVDQFGVPVDSLMHNQAALVCMFEYMIGNTDWDVSMQRNVRLLKAKETGKMLLLPYDFDFSGLVSAPYASPSSESGLKTVQDRFLMNVGVSQNSLRTATNVLRAAKKDFYEICRSKYLSRSASDEMLRYLEIFFQHAQSRDEVAGKLMMPAE